MQTHSDFIDVNGTRLYYEMAGTGQALVLIHGFSLDRRIWDDQFERFAQTYHVIRYDLRGFGQSALPNDQPYAHADDLKALLDHLGIGRAHLVGLSLGGWVAANFALAYPEVTHGLVLADAVLLGLGWSKEYLAATNPIWEAAAKEGVEAALELWLQTPLMAPAIARPDVEPRLRQIVADYSGWHFVNTDPGQTLPNVLERLQSIIAPTLVIVGEYDMADFQRIADTLLQIPKARKTIVAGSGHLVNMEAPERFNEIILEFLTNEGK